MDGEAVEQGAGGGVDAPAGHGRGRGVSAAATAPGSKGNAAGLSTPPSSLSQKHFRRYELSTSRFAVVAC